MRKYLALTSLSIVQGLRNYKVLAGLSIFLIASLVIFSHLWKIAITKVGASAFDPDLLLWYIALNEWVIISLPELQNEMEDELHNGNLAYMLPRPISYLGSKFAEGVGMLLLNLTVLGCVVFPLTWYWTDTIPCSPGTCVVMILLGVLAGILGMIIQMIVGLSAFWLHAVNPLNWLWEKLLFLFGGLLLPLSVYPIWMQKIAMFTPFPLILGERSSIALSGGIMHIVWVFTMLIVWICIGIGVLSILYKRGLRILNINGG